MSIYQDYGTIGSVSSSSDSIPFAGMIQGFLGILIFMLILLAAFSIVLLIAQWKIFTKANKPGWYSIVPFLNMWILFEISGLPGWLSLIPIVNTFALWVVYYKLPIKFGKTTGFAICTVLFPFVCLPILAFDKSVYGDSNANMFNNNMMNSYGVPPVQPYQTTESNMPFQNEMMNGQVQNDIFNQPQVYVNNEMPMQQESVNYNDTFNAVPNMTQPAKVCPICHKLNQASSMFCEDCGTKL